MAKINNTTTFPIVSAGDVANGDLLIGTDVSDTTNDAGGETKNFRVGDIRGGMTLITSGNITSATTTVDITGFIDSSTYTSYFLYYNSVRFSGTGLGYSLRIQGSNDGFSSTEFNDSLVSGVSGLGAADPEEGHGFTEFGNLALGTHPFTARAITTRISDQAFTGSSNNVVAINSLATPITAIRLSEGTGTENIENLNYYLYGLRNT